MRARMLPALVLAAAMVQGPHASAQGRKPAAPPPAPAPAAPAGPRPLSDTLSGDARADYEAAKLLARDGDFAGAEIKFKSAFDRSNDPRLLWNVAACEKNQRHYARTIDFVHQYVDKGGALLTDADRAEAKALLDTIESFTVKLTIAVSEPGADVFVDDEKVGASPLDRPVTVDIGTRKIEARKKGFRASSQQLPIGGSAQASVEIKLEPEVHAGKLTVHSQPDASISIDGQPAGTGTFEGKLGSGGHTLRVEAPGMVPYQSEVVLADDENRSIDVPLQKVYVPPPVEDKGPGFELGLQYAAGQKMNGDKPWMSTARVDVNRRVGWPTDLGFFFEGAAIDNSGVCGTDVHGAAPATPSDLAVRYAFHGCHHLKAGLQVAVHFLPAQAFDPFIAFEPGFRLSFYDYDQFDPLSSQLTTHSDVAPGIDLGLRAAVDWHPVASYRPWAIAPFVTVVVTPLAQETLNGNSNSGGGSSLAPSTSTDGNDKGHYMSLFFGLRTSLAF